jgi:hypothetical protein
VRGANAGRAGASDEAVPATLQPDLRRARGNDRGGGRGDP